MIIAFSCTTYSPHVAPTGSILKISSLPESSESTHESTKSFSGTPHPPIVIGDEGDGSNDDPDDTGSTVSIKG